MPPSSMPRRIRPSTSSTPTTMLQPTTVEPGSGPGPLRAGGFEVIVAGAQKGVGSSRETAAQCELWSGSRLAIASSFAPIHARNNINIGQLMGDHAMLARLEAGESIPLSEFTRGHDAITALIIESGGLLPFCARLAKKEIAIPAPGTAARRDFVPAGVGRNFAPVLVARGVGLVFTGD